MIRDVLLVIFAVVWGTVVVVTALRGGVPPELWGVLGVGVGGILMAFRGDGSVRRRMPRGTPPADDREDETP